MKRFSSSFLLGASTAAHQVEGNNIHSDCWALEQIPHSDYAEPSGEAVDHYHRYAEDIGLMARSGLNAYRFSIEWARIEPQEGQFQEQEIEHYRDMIHCCKENGLEPMITLHHFSNPAWLAAKGGWDTEAVIGYFVRYTRYVMERLGAEVRYVCTINEANIRLQIADIAKRYMLAAKRNAENAKSAENALQMGMNMKALLERQRVSAMEKAAAFGVSNPEDVHVFQSPCTQQGDEIICKVHAAAREAIREICPHIQVGLTLSFHDFQPQPGCEALAEQEWDKEFRHYLPYLRDDDYIGVQNYTCSRIGPEGLLPIPAGAETTQAGYEYYPQGLEHVLRRVAEDFHGDLIVTENGIATADDTRRVAFIEEATQGVKRCIDDGLPVRGYFHWSLLDNFEWQKGYAMTFGLVAVDRATQIRVPKPSLEYLGSLREKESAE